MAQESGTTVSPSTSTGTVVPPEKAMASLSVMRTGRDSASSPLWARASRVRRQ